MVIVRTNIALDMENHRGATAQMVSSTPTEVVYTSGSLTSVYRGVGLATLGDGISAGVVTGFSEYVNGSLTLDVSELNVSPIGIAPLITTGNIEMLFRSILIGNDVITGSAFDDVLAGHGGNDIYYPGTGTNQVGDTGGFDIAFLAGEYKQYSVTTSTNGIVASTSLVRQDGSSKTTVAGIERVRFDDGTLALDIGGNAGEAYRLYKAAFDRAPENGGLKFWIEKLDARTTLKSVTQAFVDSAEFQTLYAPLPSNKDFVQKLYQTALHRAGEDGGVAYWTSQLNSGTMSKAQVLSYFAESNELAASVNPQISDGIWYV